MKCAHKENDFIVAVMIHVPNPQHALHWYKKAFPGAVQCVDNPGSSEFISVGGVAIELVLSDEKVSSGTAGTVVYWHTVDFEARLNYLLSIGAELYRGPMDLENSCRMCQVLDPYGNLLGIRGTVL